MNKHRALKIASRSFKIVREPILPHEMAFEQYLNQFPKYRELLNQLLVLEKLIIIKSVGSDRMMKNPEQRKPVKAPFHLTRHVTMYREKVEENRLYLEIGSQSGFIFKELEIEIHPNPR